MKPDIDDLARQCVETWPSAGGVGDDERSAVVTEDAQCLRIVECLRPRLDRVTDRLVALELRPGSSVETRIVRHRQLLSIARRAGE
ncbi:hypothetical protein BEP68_09765 [Microbacterium sp. 4-7]|nr:hypothetical protein [Microbacterium sp. 4-7]